MKNCENWDYWKIFFLNGHCSETFLKILPAIYILWLLVYRPPFFCLFLYTSEAWKFSQILPSSHQNFPFLMSGGWGGGGGFEWEVIWTFQKKKKVSPTRIGDLIFSHASLRRRASQGDILYSVNRRVNALRRQEAGGKGGENGEVRLERGRYIDLWSRTIW